jgi:hypothetical protein
MNDKPSRVPNPQENPPAKPIIPEPPGDGFPPEKDVSTPPPDSDVNKGRHKKPEE